MVRDGTDEDDNDLVSAVGGLTVALIFAVAFGGLALDVAYWWVAFPVGFGGVLPAAVALARRRWGDEQAGDEQADDERTASRESAGTTDDAPDPEAALQTLRERYAAGEIDEVTFERRVDRLLETETIADAEATVERARRERDRSTEGERGSTEGERGSATDRETAEER